MSEGLDEKGYFRAIEETFIRLRGAPLLLSPTDWKIAQEWRRQAIPLAIVVAALEQVFAKRAESHPGEKVNSLRYCAPAVARAWVEASENLEPARRAAGRELDLGVRLRALAEALPTSWPGSGELADRILGLSGSAEEVEIALGALDREMLELARAGLDEARARALQQELEGRLEKLAVEQRRAGDPRVRASLESTLLRETLRLPHLSLFAPEAEAVDTP